MKRYWLNRFLYAVALILFIAAAAVLYFAIVGGLVLDLQDVLLGVSYRKVFYLVSLLLLAVSAFLLTKREIPLRLGLLTWLSGNLLMYHFATAYNHSANLWAALGNLSPCIPIAPQANYVVVSVLLVGLFLCSGGLSVADWWLRRRKYAKQASNPELSPGLGHLALK